MDSVANSDPSGFLPAALAAVRLVGAVAKVAPHVKNSVDNYRNNNAGSNAQVGPGLSRQISQNDPAAAAAALSLNIDPERESRAYETVNYVLRTLGNRIGEAGLVSAPALARALTAAATHIEVELFSVNANRLFRSLASKLKDAVLVNSVFTSIYFIGAITAELSSSLPQYKATYPPLGPFIIQQIFRAAIGEDAFRENITANLDAYKTLATTAGLLRPTDIGYSIFPGFPSLSPTRYSAKSFTEVRNHKNIFQTLVKHFDFHGFPQPKPGLDAGPIKDWRFLSGDANSKWYEVERADKHIGEAIGRVLYWLICGADRMQAGMAVIAYYKQHIELIQWMGSRFGYRVLNGKQDLDLTGPHLRLENKYRATIEAWVIIMPSATAQINKQQTAAQWNQINNFQPPTPISPSLSNASTSHGRLSMSSSVSSVDTSTATTLKPGVNATAQPNGTNRSIGIGSAIAHAGAAARRSESYPKPSAVHPGAQSTLSSPGLPAHAETPTMVASPSEQSTASTPVTSAVTELSTTASSPTLEPFPSADYGHPAANLPPHLSHAHNPPVPPSYSHTPPLSNVSNNPHGRPISSYTHTPPLSHLSSNTSAPSPSYFPPVSSQTSGNSMDTSQPLVNNRPQPATRRRAPPPPRKFPLAKALYDFGPEEEGGEELLFHEGDELEIVEKSEELEADGWCKARIKGTTHVGLAPVEYLEEIKVVKKAPPPPGGAARARMAPGPANAVPMRSLSGGGHPGLAAPQGGGVARSISSASMGGRPHSGTQPHLIGIHENPHSYLNVHQNPNGRPHSVAMQNPHGHPHSHIPINPQMQHNPYAHPVHSTQPELPGHQLPGPHQHPGHHQHPEAIQHSEAPQHYDSHQHQSSHAPQETQQSPNPQAPAKPQSNVQQSSNTGGGTTAQKPSQSRDINVDIKINTPSKQPAGTQQATATQPNQATGQGQQGRKLRQPAVPTNPAGRGQPPRVSLSSQLASAVTFAPSLSLNLGGGRGSGQQQGPGPNPNRMQNNNARYQNYNAAGPNAGMYANDSNYNANMQATGYYGSNAQPIYAADPAMMYGSSGYYNTGSGYDGEEMVLSAAGGALAGEAMADPSSFMSSVTDLASLDPFYAQMNPDFASDTSTTDAGGYDGTDDGVEENTSALASLGLDAGGTTGMDSSNQSAAADSLGLGGGMMESPLAGLAPPDESSAVDPSAEDDTSAPDAGGFDAGGFDAGGYDTGVSSLAGLAPPEDTGATSAADLGASVDQSGDVTAYDDGSSDMYAAAASAQMQAEGDNNALALLGGATSDTVYEEETTTSSSFWSSVFED